MGVRVGSASDWMSGRGDLAIDKTVLKTCQRGAGSKKTPTADIGKGSANCFLRCAHPDLPGWEREIAMLAWTDRSHGDRREASVDSRREHEACHE
jgi:hypothetical protein